MKYKLTLCLALISLCRTSRARLVRSWSEAELQKASDVIVIGRPVGARDLDETNSLGWPRAAFRGVETTFKIFQVLKGIRGVDQIVLHHYREEFPGSLPNGPGFVRFTTNDTKEYVLYLVRDGANRYAPAAGQVDANLSVRPPPDLYLHLFSSFVYPEPPRLIVSAPIYLARDFEILMDNHESLKGRIESRNGKYFVQFQGVLCSGTNVFSGEAALEKADNPWPAPYDAKAPFICQPHFMLSLDSSPKSLLRRQAAAEKEAWYRQSHHIDEEEYFRSFLAGCATNEIRCLWFLQDEYKVGMELTINLQDSTALAQRDVYNWALQGAGPRKLDSFQVLTLKQIADELPSSDGKVEFNRAVSVSMRKGGQTNVFRYDRQHAPAGIQRIYDITGAYFYSGKANPPEQP